MRCTSCEKDIASGARFCPFCRAEQTATASAATATRDKANGPSARNGADSPFSSSGGDSGPEAAQAVTSDRPRRYVVPSVATSPEDVLVLRAGEKIWQIEEDEGQIAPGERRPLLILDEQAAHLAHTARYLTPETLLRRVQEIVRAQGVPVSVELRDTRWVRDSREMRPRVVACLQGHPYGDIKLLLGVDYLGSWASIQMHMGVEPEALPPAPPPPPGWTPPVDAVLAIVVGILLLLVFIGVFPLAYGIWRMVTSKKQWDAKQIEDGVRQRQEQAQRERKKALERLARTFKVDDMRLFCSAMKAVFATVVDDIVEQGGEVTRIEGGQGGFFQTDGLAQVGTPLHRTDAAALGV